MKARFRVASYNVQYNSHSLIRRMCGGQKGAKIAQILLFLDDLLIFYQASGMSLPFTWCGLFIAGGAWVPVRNRVSIRMITVGILLLLENAIRLESNLQGLSYYIFGFTYLLFRAISSVSHLLNIPLPLAGCLLNRSFTFRKNSCQRGTYTMYLKD